MVMNATVPPRPRFRGARDWLNDRHALIDLWVATCGLGGPGLMLLLGGAEVIRLGLIGRAASSEVASLADGPLAKAAGFASLPSSVTVGIYTLCTGLVLLVGARCLLRARAEVMRLRGECYDGRSTSIPTPPYLH